MQAEPIFSSEALWRRSKDSYKSLTSCPCDWTVFTIAFKTTLLPLSCSPVVDIWSAAVAKGVWKDTADCRGKTGRCTVCWGVRQPGAVKCEALPSQLMIKDRHNRRWWPWLPARPNAQCGLRCQQRWAASKQRQLEKRYHCWHRNNTSDLTQKQNLNNASSIIHEILCVLLLTLCFPPRLVGNGRSLVARFIKGFMTGDYSGWYGGMRGRACPSSPSAKIMLMMSCGILH